MMDDQEFERIVCENERLIHYHIRSLQINDRNGDFFAEGLFALWQAFSTYKPELGQFSTYISWKIRNALIDKIRKDSKTEEVEARFQTLYKHNAFIENDIHDELFWQQVKSHLSTNQWKWVYYYIILDRSVEQIAKLEGVTPNAVKNWGKHARKKLKEVRFDT
ncbi:sigma-70 family RNA polymerase sigma factor [Halobacillus yeomjeoni]|nr:sigma-70 family RNA polymerase sigma factor [Halobacillus yeomjeoni]